MLIRKDQLQAFQQAEERNYEMRLVRFLKNQFQDAAHEPEASLAEEIREQIAKARSYGLLTEQQIAAYITAGWLLGGDFDHEFPAAYQMLTSDGPADKKNDWLEQFTRDLFHTLEQRV